MLSVGEAARGLGVSVRSLHHWEAQGLITPRRSPSGQRRFGAAEIMRLGQIIQLKRLGLPLAEIARLLAQDNLEAGMSAADILSTQKAILSAQITEITIAISAIDKALHCLDCGQDISLPELIHALKLGETTMSEDAWQKVYDAYYTPEEQAKWAAVKQSFSEQEIRDSERQWAALLSRIEAMVAAGTSPHSDEAQSALQDWRALIQPIFDRDPSLVEGANRMYDDMQNWQDKAGPEAPSPPFSPAVWSFIQAAGAASAQPKKV